MMRGVAPLLEVTMISLQTPQVQDWTQSVQRIYIVRCTKQIAIRIFIISLLCLSKHCNIVHKV